MIAVIDASALVNCLASPAANLDPRLDQRVRSLYAIQAPAIFPTEVYSALRGLIRGKKLNEEEAEALRVIFDETPTILFPFSGLANRVWELRHNFTIYDASYLALAEALDAPLITTDRKLAAPHLHNAQVEVYNVAERRAK